MLWPLRLGDAQRAPYDDPGDAEWEHVAAGGSEQLEYPWGSAAPGTACPGTGCEYAIYNCVLTDGQNRRFLTA